MCGVEGMSSPRAASSCGTTAAGIWLASSGTCAGGALQSTRAEGTGGGSIQQTGKAGDHDGNHVLPVATACRARLTHRPAARQKPALR